MRKNAFATTDLLLNVGERAGKEKGKEWKYGKQREETSAVPPPKKKHFVAVLVLAFYCICAKCISHHITVGKTELHVRTNWTVAGYIPLSACVVSNTPVKQSTTATATLKMRERKMPDWNSQPTRNASVENAVPQQWKIQDKTCRVGNCMTWKCGNRLHLTQIIKLLYKSRRNIFNKLVGV